MTSLDRTPDQASLDTRILGWLSAVTALVAVVAATVLALTGHTAIAATVTAVGLGAGAAGGIRVTVNVRR